MAGIQRSSAARALARKLALQALYRWQINPCPWQDLVQEFAADESMARADAEYFQLLVQSISNQHEILDAALEPCVDIKPSQFDPIEHAILWIATFELLHRPDIPYRVVINEAVSLCKRFGATDGHKFVNGALDRAARDWRVSER
jgi:N utilization substance protein B